MIVGRFRVVLVVCFWFVVGFVCALLLWFSRLFDCLCCGCLPFTCVCIYICLLLDNLIVKMLCCFDYCTCLIVFDCLLCGMSLLLSWLSFEFGYLIICFAGFSCG